jgi:hypothetical protein
MRSNGDEQHHFYKFLAVVHFYNFFALPQHQHDRGCVDVSYDWIRYHSFEYHQFYFRHWNEHHRNQPDRNESCWNNVR